MTTGYDGSIRIDTRINTGSLERGISQIEYMLESLSSGISEFQDNFADAGDGFSQIEDKLTSIAAIIGMAFGAEELINFGKQAVDAASDLAEAQNVVDTAFGDMSYKMEKFADTALETYGISELTAKNMGSTYMAMAKGMGVATDAASDMAITLTGRLSDIMSFYNKTQSEVDTIGRAIITGETELLKAIGVVMSQTNLSAYAMAQGFSKTYAEMSSNEQLLVRYKYFLEQTAMAQGDFAKTSEGWANQTRMLSERLNEFMTNLGNVLINTLTPALQFVNEAVMFLNDLFFGGESAEDATAVKNAEAVTDEVTAVGAAADKSEKKLNNLLSSFDELHIISGAKSEDENTDAGIDTSGLLGASLDADNKIAEKSSGKYREILDEIYLAFKQHPLTKTIKKIIKQLGEFFGVIKENGDISAGDIVTALMDILGAIIAFKTISGVVGGIKTFASGFSGLIGIITAHPVVAAIVGITALTIGIIALDDEMKRQEVASHFGDISISLDELHELTDPIRGDVDEIAKAFQDNASRIETARDNFVKLAIAIQDTTDALGEGGDINEFLDQVDEYINAALALTDATNDTSGLRQLYMADGQIDEREQAVLDSVSSLGDSVKGKIETIREQIHSITQAAADENRALTEAEIQNIKDLYDELARITSTEADAKQTAVWERLMSRAYSYDSYDVLLDDIKKAREETDKSLDEIRDASYNQLGAIIAEARANGESEEEIQKRRTEWKETLEKSLDEKKKQSLLYEQQLLNAFGDAHYFDIYDDEKLENFLNKHFRSDEERERFKQYYELIKDAASKGADVDVYALAQSIGDEYYATMLGALFDEIDRQDKTYNDWGTEMHRVADELKEVGHDGAVGMVDEIENVIKGATAIDGTAVLADAQRFTDKGKDDATAYVNALTETLSGMEMPWIWGGETQTTSPISNSDPVKPRNLDYIDSYLKNSPTPSDYVRPVFVGPQTLEQTLKIQLNVDGFDKGTQTIKTNGSSTISIDRWKDMTVTNGQ